MRGVKISPVIMSPPLPSPPPQFKVSSPDARRHLSPQSCRAKASGKNCTHEEGIDAVYTHIHTLKHSIINTKAFGLRHLF